VSDNILSEITSTGATGVTLTPNHLTSSQPPTYVGPTTSWAGYKLAAGSPGSVGASDGLAFGIR
jgi:hypothetical protein